MRRFSRRLFSAFFRLSACPVALAADLDSSANLVVGRANAGSLGAASRSNPFYAHANATNNHLLKYDWSAAWLFVPLVER